MKETDVASGMRTYAFDVASGEIHAETPDAILAADVDRPKGCCRRMLSTHLGSFVLLSLSLSPCLPSGPKRWRRHYVI
jgi:DNA-directed RNA polymerase subunit N (RpoN/RPB10)